MISVVVPNLNEERYLRKFLGSLCYQSEKNFEVIIIDGGSTDQSLEICELFKDRLCLRVVVDKTPNIGFIRNLGAKLTGLGENINQGTLLTISGSSRKVSQIRPILKNLRTMSLNLIEQRF